jgi:hypothetical protein
VAWSDEQRVRAYLQALPQQEPPPGLEARLLAITSQPLPAPVRASTGAALAVLMVALVAGLLWRPAAPGPRDRTEAPEAPPAAVPAGAGERPAGRIRRLGAVSLVTPPATAAPPAATAAPALVGSAAQAAVRAPATPAAAPSSALAAAVVLAAAGGPAGDPEHRPKPSATTAPVCIPVRVTVFADLAGTGPDDRPCPGCDGRLDDGDLQRARELGLALAPGLQVVLLRGDEALAEANVPADSASAVQHVHLRACGPLSPAGLTAQLLNVAEPWGLCPALGAIQPLRQTDEGLAATFALTTACPAPGATAPAATAGPATPVADQTPGVATPEAPVAPPEPLPIADPGSMP